MVTSQRQNEIIVSGMSLGTIVNQMIFISYNFPYVLGERKDLDQHSSLICRNYDSLREELDRRERKYLEKLK